MPLRNWQEFESLCCDLWRLIWNDKYAKKNGRSGQQQCGVDICGSPAPGQWEAVQCKGKNGTYGKKVTVAELNGEVEKAKAFKPALSVWILATTSEKDATVELRAREITDEHRSNGLFRVEFFGWEDIVELLSQYPELVRRYYPDSFPSGKTESPRGRAWVKDFLTPLVEAANDITRQFESMAFWGRLQGIGGGEYYWVIDFVDLEAWRRFRTSRTAEQFLKSNENIADQLTELEKDFGAFADFIKQTIDSILDDQKIIEIIGQRYHSHLDGLKRPDPRPKSVVEMLRELHGGSHLDALAREDVRITFFTSRFFAYAVFGFEIGFSNGCWQDPSLWNFCSEIIDEIGVEYFKDRRNKMDRLRQKVISKTTELSEAATALRDQLCEKHDITYE